MVSCTPSWFWGPVVTLEDCLAAFFAADELKGEWAELAGVGLLVHSLSVTQPCLPGDQMFPKSPPRSSEGFSCFSSLTDSVDKRKVVL